MNREYVKWFSPALNREMEMLVFGHGGAPIIALPTSMGRFYEYEDFGMVRALTAHLEQGWAQLFCVDGVDNESWYNFNVHPTQRVARHQQYESYILNETVPYIRGRNSNPFLMVTGCSFGAYQAANLAFRHPETFSRVISISGLYDLQFLLRGYFDEGCYFNSPMAYLPNLTDDRYLIPLRSHLQIILCVGGWSDICHDGTQALAKVLREKSIPHTLDVWDQAWHDWPWWHQMTLKHV